ncbi:hypothetical protein SS1G_11449 [Sclerotinia sclerotiorum 1980 UF-70]|uniref:Uncharacterized protein n=1 Tax=Sclerotinia sclerotiorum (strain ATCC 18683 / 1980 / Ss-1) TaxID=665079 RepID=A7F1H9_SCLS1|nr:hypothetical protein SS1G_11449 [Sclerotinia sclerotiorum 1980 UF-70]EDN95571.1 hypothetical protein SS1G_11449 [Sclerotinia sclerotiorum 1980 UF-70]
MGRDTVRVGDNVFEDAMLRVYELDVGFFGAISCRDRYCKISGTGCLIQVQMGVTRDVVKRWGAWDCLLLPSAMTTSTRTHNNVSSKNVPHDPTV